MKRLVMVFLTAIALISAAGVAGAEGILTKYTFIPGESQLLFEDLSTTPIGEVPSSLHVNGEAEVVLIGGARWLRLSEGAEAAIPLKEQEELTLEFEMRSGDVESNSIQIMLENEDAGYYASIYVRGEGAEWEGAYGDGSLPGNSIVKSLFAPNEAAAVAMTMQKNRFKMYVNRQLVMNVTDFAPVMPILIRVRAIQTELVAARAFRVATVIPDIAAEILQKGRYVSHGVYFDVGSARVKEASHYVLKQVAEVLEGNPDLRLKISGHTDSAGDKASNKALSMKRAESVKEYLIREFSVSATRLEVEGLGDEKPVADNRTSEGRALNRRVEFWRIP